MTAITLALSGDQHEHLKSFLFPGDGNEAVAVLLCGRRAGDRRHRLCVREVHAIPHDHCSERTPRKVTWQTDAIAPILERATELGLSFVKVHSHPTGFPVFSDIDDESDRLLLPMVRGWIEADIFHGSAVMLPDGQILAGFSTLTGHSGTSARSALPVTTFTSGIPTQAPKPCQVSPLPTHRPLTRARSNACRK